MLPKEINKIIQKHLKRIYNDIPADEILTDLQADGVLTEREVSRIKKFDEIKDKNFELIRILKTRGINDFFKLCTALKDQDTENSQKLGTLLENEAKKAVHSESINDTISQAVSSANTAQYSVSTNNSDQVDSGFSDQPIAAANNTGPAISGMSLHHRKLLQKHTVNIQNNIRSSLPGILDELFSQGVINPNLKQNIESEKNAQSKVNALLNILPERGSKAFDAFLVALRKNEHEELATSIQK